MGFSIVKETVELNSVTCDADGNAWITKKINLKEGQRHILHQVDYFVDRYPNFGTATNGIMEVVVTAYPSIPTNMDFSSNVNNGNLSYVAAGDNSVLFKAHKQIYDLDSVASPNRPDDQFPSEQISAMNTSYFYTDHIYINLCFKVAPDEIVSGLALSFMFVLEDKNCSILEHSLGVLSESHDAMCAQVMSNGYMRRRADLDGNVFPMWRFGGIRPENTLPPTAANTFFLRVASRDAEPMQRTNDILQSVDDARQMSAFNAAFGLRRPDWLREFLNAGIESGPIRPNPIPLRYADNGNTRMF